MRDIHKHSCRKAVLTVPSKENCEGKNTNGCGLYRTAQEARSGVQYARSFLDGVCTERVSNHLLQDTPLAFFVRKKKKIFLQYANAFESSRAAHLFLSGRRGLAVSVVSIAVCTGLLSFAFPGTRAMADDASPIILAVGQKVLGVETERAGSVSDQAEFERQIRRFVAGYPIEDMVPYIAKQDRRVAAYLVAIAKKESNWGRRIPVYYGENCFNYWGYRGQDEIMGSAGHTCFDTPKEAVATVAKRLNTLVLEQGLVTASDLIVWKCGSSCAGHDAYGVSKWISDVDGYYQKVFAMGE